MAHEGDNAFMRLLAVNSTEAALMKQLTDISVSLISGSNVRQKTPSKVAQKTNELRPKEWLIQCRELWAEQANLALQRAGHEARIDHRTLEAQGINRAPTIHLGPSVAAMERKGIRTPRGSKLARAPVVQPEKQALPVTAEIKTPTAERSAKTTHALAGAAGSDPGISDPGLGNLGSFTSLLG